MTTPIFSEAELREALRTAEEEIDCYETLSGRDDLHRKAALAAMSAIASRARADAIEEAAKVAEGEASFLNYIAIDGDTGLERLVLKHRSEVAAKIASAICALAYPTPIAPEAGEE